MGETDEKLSPRHQAFVDAYLSNGFNATKAAIAAGYSETSASVRGHQLIRNDNVRLRIDAHLEASGASRDKVLQELTALAFKTDMRHFEGLTAGKTLEQLHEAGIDTRMIRELDVKAGEKDTQVKVKLYDRQRAIEQLVKVMGLEQQADTQGEGTQIMFPANGPQQVSDADTDE